MSKPVDHSWRLYLNTTLKKKQTIKVTTQININQYSEFIKINLFYFPKILQNVKKLNDLMCF